MGSLCRTLSTLVDISEWRCQLSLTVRFRFYSIKFLVLCGAWIRFCQPPTVGGHQTSTPAPHFFLFFSPSLWDPLCCCCRSPAISATRRRGLADQQGAGGWQIYFQVRYKIALGLASANSVYCTGTSKQVMLCWI